MDFFLLPGFAGHKVLTSWAGLPGISIRKFTLSQFTVAKKNKIKHYDIIILISRFARYLSFYHYKLPYPIIF
jgi:hypothetical protein